LSNKYDEIKDEMSYYLLLQAYAFLKTSGNRDIAVARRYLSKKASETTIWEAKIFPGDLYTEALGHSVAKHMGDAFNSKYDIQVGRDYFRVILEDCGYIGCILKHAPQFDIEESSCRTIFCGSCLDSYRLSAKKLGLKFHSSISHLGCQMTFSTIPTPQ
jgi:hypothetical protein